MIFARILNNNCPKNIFPEVWEHVRTLMPPPHLLCLCFGQIGMAATRGNGYVYLTCWDPERGGGLFQNALVVSRIDLLSGALCSATLLLLSPILGLYTGIVNYWCRAR